MTKEQARETIAKLIDRFDDQIETYKSASYNEAQTRVDFINKFFKALGWDVDNEQGASENYREVMSEYKQKVGGRTKSPDYGFKLSGGKKLFFVEAKKPSVNIKADKDAAYQIRTYGWNAPLAISVITNFEEFAIYDCNKKANPYDSASVSRLRYFTYKDYLEEFDFLWDVFSREGVVKGRFDKFVKSKTYKKGNSTIDIDFLASLNEWRQFLATNISKNNHGLDDESVGLTVQLTIDRLIFLRFCEDRFVENYGAISTAVKSGNAYNNLLEIFRQADEKYNSGLFDFKKDTISRAIKVDNKVLKFIVDGMYFPKSQYRFDVMPVDILGNAYEQFLGKVIRITRGHIVKIEEKPEVRKAGGVYYTPQYIVEYIVANTVGKWIEGKTPEEISKLKIVDPACGSGSFLLGAYDHLLTYHKDWYYKNGYHTKKVKNNPLTPDEKLTTAEKSKILLNNIYGVDIDPQAVEVSKLSLLLKAMEGETEASISQQLKVIHERVLPNLDENIRCGNSLIEHDIEGMFEYEDIVKEKIRPFNWVKKYPLIFKEGGFDILIGNPPYVQPNILNKGSQQYLLNRYKANTDLYSIFIERSLNALIKKGSKLGFIVPSLFLKGVRYESLRSVINTNCSGVEIKEYGDGVFNNVQMPTCVILLTKGGINPQSDYFTNENKKLFNKIKTIQLHEISEIRRGLEIGRDQLFDKGAKICLSGINLDHYRTKGTKYISKDTYKAFSKDEYIFLSPKIMVRETGDKFYAAIDYSNILTTRSIYNTKIISKKYSPEFILAVINSKLFQFYYRQFISPETNIFPKIRIAQLKELPIPLNPDKIVVNTIKKNVDSVLKLNKEKDNMKLAIDKEQTQSQISYLEDKIDELVYELYGLNKEEIETIKNSIK